MIEFFPPAKQHQIRSVLAGVLRGVISQRLLPRVEYGRVAAVEVMVMNSRIADLIREQRTEEIADAVAEGGFFDMQTFEQALIDLVLARSRATSPRMRPRTRTTSRSLSTTPSSGRRSSSRRRRPPKRLEAEAEEDAPALRVVRHAEA